MSDSGEGKKTVETPMDSLEAASWKIAMLEKKEAVQLSLFG